MIFQMNITEYVFNELKKENLVNNNRGLEKFYKMILKLLNRVASIKKIRNTKEAIKCHLLQKIFLKQLRKD